MRVPESRSSSDRSECGPAGLTLRDLTSVQQKFDSSHFTGASDDAGKRRHIILHLGILGGKLFRIEERLDHGALDRSCRDVLIDEVIPDLLVYAAQLATLEGVDLETAYKKRLNCIRMRSQGAGYHYDMECSASWFDKWLAGDEYDDPCSDQSTSDLTGAVMEVVKDGTLGDKEVRDALATRVTSLGFNPSLSRILGNYAVSVRKLRAYADSFISMEDVEREVHSLIERGKAQLTGRRQ